jgi:hypothetical protein
MNTLVYKTKQNGVCEKDRNNNNTRLKVKNENSQRQGQKCISWKNMG